MKKTGVLVGGQGGQGVLELGNYIAYNALAAGKHVAFTPSYGPESRGGRVKCFVVISDGNIDSPIVERPDYLIAMNSQSMGFVSGLVPGGTLIMNSSMIAVQTDRKDITVIGIPATDIAATVAIRHGIPETGIAANCVMLGCFLELSHGGADEKALLVVFDHFLRGSKSRFIAVNMEAAKQGRTYAVSTGSAGKAMMRRRNEKIALPLHSG